MGNRRFFVNREEAGKLLFEKLKAYKEKKDVIILAIPRGGVIVGAILSKNLDLDFDIIVVRKIGHPNNPELAIGAVGPRTVYWDKNLLKTIRILGKDQLLILQKLKENERKEKEKVLRANKKPLNIKDKNIILVDDGVATGATVIAAALALKKQKAKKIILAVPVISKDTLEKIKNYFNDVVTLIVEESFQAVGQFYLNFPQVEDQKVIEILNSKL